MKLIDPKDVESIKALGIGECALPDIDYYSYSDINRSVNTVNGLYSLLQNKGLLPSIVQSLNWAESDTKTDWNERLVQLGELIRRLIDQVEKEMTDDQLVTIFVLIQMWGGIAGRGVFVRGDDWPANFDVNTYRKGIGNIEENEISLALETLNEISYVSTAFSTKHIKFWSRDKFPVFDSIISSIVFGRRTPRANDYTRLLECFTELGKEKKGLESKQIERNLFNWSNTDDGEKWIRLRLINS